jgi:hypothetical protein
MCQRLGLVEKAAQRDQRARRWRLWIEDGTSREVLRTYVRQCGKYAAHAETVH